MVRPTRTKSSYNRARKKKSFPRKGEIFVRRSTGRKERFDTNRMAQTISRSGTPYLMARDIAKVVSSKIKQESRRERTSSGLLIGRAGGRKRTPIINKQQNSKVVTASRVRNLVAKELQDRNKGEIAASYSGNTIENVVRYQNINQKESVNNRVRAVNKRGPMHDTTKRGGGLSA